MSKAFIVQPDAGRTLDLGNFEAVVLASAAQTAGEFTLLQTQNEPPDFGPPLHIHHDAAEAFYVLSGEYLMFIEDRQEQCPPGTFVYVPRGMPHTFKVVSAEAEAKGEATPELLDAIATHNNMEVVGPVPDTYL